MVVANHKRFTALSLSASIFMLIINAYAHHMQLLTKSIKAMKKLLMSLVAMAIMSSAAFANSGENASGKEAVAGKSYVKAIKEVTEFNHANRRTLCRLTVSIYNTSGQLIDTQVVTHTIYDGGNNMFYNSCSEFFSATIQNYQSYYGNPNH